MTYGSVGWVEALRIRKRTLARSRSGAERLHEVERSAKPNIYKELTQHLQGVDPAFTKICWVILYRTHSRSCLNPTYKDYRRLLWNLSFSLTIARI
ncbi:MAG: hypothetical protein KME64_08230 [Scytonematopsis contorta HA4267-MV1]|nr:hypothetical protein [Scytonematopsis contorta HA4267-MV1]